MAEATCPFHPDLSIVLFNVHSSDKVTTDDRLQCLKHVLTEITEKCQGPLFVLCQDKIDNDKHLTLKRKLGNGYKLNEEAGIYYRSEDCPYDVSDVNVEREAGVAAFKFPGENVRLVACVLKHRQTSKTILLVSWHGPSKVSDDRYKMAVFQTLVCLLDTMRLRGKYHAVVVGGDFNMSHDLARRCLCQLGHLEGAVLSDYVTTSDRQDLPILDYIVYWPRDTLQVLETLVICRDFRREKWTYSMEMKMRKRTGQAWTEIAGRPFDHPIVTYRFGNAVEDAFRRHAALRGGLNITTEANPIASGDDHLSQPASQTSELGSQTPAHDDQPPSPTSVTDDDLPAQILSPKDSLDSLSDSPSHLHASEQAEQTSCTLLQTATELITPEAKGRWHDILGTLSSDSESDSQERTSASKDDM